MIHILASFSWAVGGVALCVIVFITYPESGDELYMRSKILQIIDDYFIICGAMGALITGLIYGIWTNWGFFKHRWIVFKWIMIVLQILFGAFVLGPRVNDNVVIADQLRNAALTNPVFINNLQITQIFGTIQTILLLIVIVVSVQKPWKKNKTN
jgi:hypothetical protein